MKYLIIFILFYLSVNVNAQLYVPHVRGMDRQIVMPDNHLILINTYFLGDLMDMYEDDKEITIEYAIFSPKGELITDTSLSLKWKDMHYNYMDCICTYNPHYKIDKIYNEVNSNKGTCPIYFPYFNESELVLSYFLRGDRRNIYEISIKNNGENNWHIYNIDILSAEQGTPNASAIKTEMDKSLFFKSFLDDKYSDLKIPQQTKLVYDSILHTYTIKDKNITFSPMSKQAYSRYIDMKNLPIITHQSPTDKYSLLKSIDYKSNIYTNKPFYSLKDFIKLKSSLTITESFPKYLVSGENWVLVLNGSIIGFEYIDKPANPPLIDMKGDILFVTVFNDDYEKYPGNGKDIYPIVYAIDIKKGKILWQKMLY